MCAIEAVSEMVVCLDGWLEKGKEKRRDIATDCAIEFRVLFPNDPEGNPYRRREGKREGNKIKGKAWCVAEKKWREGGDCNYTVVVRTESGQ